MSKVEKNKKIVTEWTKSPVDKSLNEYIEARNRVEGYITRSLHAEDSDFFRDVYTIINQANKVEGISEVLEILDDVIRAEEGDSNE